MDFRYLSCTSFDTIFQILQISSSISFCLKHNLFFFSFSLSSIVLVISSLILDLVIFAQVLLHSLTHYFASRVCALRVNLFKWVFSRSYYRRYCYRWMDQQRYSLSFFFRARAQALLFHHTDYMVRRRFLRSSLFWVQFSWPQLWVTFYQRSFLRFLAARTFWESDPNLLKYESGFAYSYILLSLLYSQFTYRFAGE